MCKLYRKRVSPRFVYKATNRTSNDRCWGGSSTVTPKRKERENTRETNANNGGSTKTKKPRGRSPPEIAHQAPSLRSTGTHQHLQEGTRRRRRCCQGFPPVHCEERGEVAPTPFRKVMRYPQAPPRRCRPSQQGFLPIPTSTSGTPELATKQTLTLRQPGHEASHAVSPRHREAWSAQRRRGAGTRAAAPSARGRAPPPPSKTVADRTQ